MKLNSIFRLVLTILIFATTFLLLESKRKHQKNAANKANKKMSGEANKFKASNTDYIFFESLSKYLFISLQ